MYVKIYTPVDWKQAIFEVGNGSKYKVHILNL